MQTVLTHDRLLRIGAAAAIQELLLKYTAADFYESEEVRSTGTYPTSYYVLPVEAQVIRLKTLFPGLKTVNEKLARKTHSEEAEGWFVFLCLGCVARQGNVAHTLKRQHKCGGHAAESRLRGPRKGKGGWFRPQIVPKKSKGGTVGFGSGRFPEPTSRWILNRV
jgi:hypothetical protein